MSAFKDKLKIEAEGEKYLMPYLKARFPKLEKCHYHKSHHYRPDYQYEYMGRKLYLELKIVDGNYNAFFIETESDRKKGVKGWVYRLEECHCFLYFCMGSRTAYSFHGHHLSRVLLSEGYLDKFPERMAIIEQDNDTWGRLVNVKRLMADVGKEWSSSIYLPDGYMVDF